MEYISAEEFLKQDKEVQEVFIDWWMKNYNDEDLIGYIGKAPIYIKSFPNTLKHTACDCFSIGNEIIPLLTEGQLRKFIEDKTGCIIDTTILKSGYKIYLNKNSRWQSYHVTLEKSLIKAYWEVAVDIANQC
ncbi:Uncharacterised protein [Clostridium carnis]|uniref:Uncharacterized protein n=1 Tax=Clostridium carnis TaxID=1530 RepID=A0ABY6T1S9_9CLOT|nr:hypothetical protein [Clostridium carnis]VDG74618.1 Uncharacterised protein [Clostridium carnis]